MPSIEELINGFPQAAPDLNEAGVREELVAPVLAALGYSSFGTNQIRRERTLRYPYVQLGRKGKPGERPLRGKPDYELDAGPNHRIVIECKSTSESLTDDDVDQAYSYAAHPEVRAVMFVLTNGHEWRFYLTHSANPYEPWHQISYSRMKFLPNELEFLAPEAVIQSFPLPATTLEAGIYESDKRTGLTGRGNMAFSFAELELFGSIQELDVMYRHQTNISNLRAQRNKEGRIQICFDTLSENPHVAAYQHDTGFYQVDAVAHSKFLSGDAENPTLITGEYNTIIEAGSELNNPENGELVIMPFDLMILQKFQASLVCADTVGRFIFEGRATVYGQGTLMGRQLYLGTGQIEFD